MLRTAILSILITGAAMSALGEQADFEIQQHLIRGVYWPWERTKIHAAHANMELWQFVDHLMGRISKEWHCNLVWFVNGPAEPARVCDIAAKHNLLVLSGTRLAGIFVHGLRGEEQLATAVKQTVEQLASKPALGAYVLKDEAKNVEKAQMETYRQALAAADPKHPSIIVTMTSHTEVFAVDSGFPVICTDIYHFGGVRSPAIPNPARRSRATFRQCVTALTDMTKRHGKTAWNMPQAFADVWGAHWLDADENIVIEPGSYWHWRMPSVAETRWQIWESIRAGCKGVVFFVILAGGREDWTPAEGEMPEKMQKALERNKGSQWPLTNSRIDTHEPKCLTRNGGRATPQAVEMGNTYRTLAAHEAVIVRWRPARLPFVSVDAPGKCRAYRDPADPKVRYAVVVNDATGTTSASPVVCRFLPNTVTVTDLLTTEMLTLADESSGNERLQQATITLPPGGGTILKLEFRNGKTGLLLYDEDFSKSAITAKLDGVSRRRERRGFGMGSAWRLRKDGPPDADAIITLDGLTKHTHGRGSHLCTALHDVAKGKAIVYLQVDGRCPEPEAIVVQLVAKDGTAGWNKTDAYRLPFAVPAGTDAIRIRLTDNGAVDRIRLWRVDVP